MDTLLGIKVNNRFDEVEKMQNVFTEYGFMIHTRLGLHSQEKNNASDNGIILLQLNDNGATEGRELESKLQQIEGLQVKKMSF